MISPQHNLHSLTKDIKRLSCRMKFFLPVFFLSFLTLSKGTSVSIHEMFEFHKIVPDVIQEAPTTVLECSFNGLQIKLADTLTVEQTKMKPILKWPTVDTYYTVIMTDADSPSPMHPKLKELQHWIVGNIRQTNFSVAETFVDYTGPRNEVDQGPHRYVISVFEQIGKLIFAEKFVEKDNMLLRGLFSTKSFVSKYRLRGPVAATFFFVNHPYNSTTTPEAE